MKPSDIVKWRKISVFLTGKPENIRSGYSREKHSKAITELKNLLKNWMEKYRY